MLGAPEVGGDVALETLREREFARLRIADTAYLDYAGSALYGTAQLRAHESLLGRLVLGNPHAANLPSRSSSSLIGAARQRVLDFLDAPDGGYTVCFTANASAAIKLVAESYPFGAARACVLSADNHNSMNGVREYARRAHASVTYLPLGPDLRLREPVSALRRSPPGAGLFGFPAQSNFSGVLHPLGLVREAQALGFDVLLDLAGYAPAHAFSLRQYPADFVVLSFYKIFGYPTGLGALVARRSALARLGRPWFAGGTVTWASVGDLRHRPLPLHEGFEDGTPDFLAIAALDAGFDLLAEVGMARLERHVGELTALLLRGLRRLRHTNGARLSVIYGPSDIRDRGGTVAFNVLDPAGLAIPFERVEERANAAGVALRGGCFCNPGASEAAFGIERGSAAACLDSLGADFSHEGLRSCLGEGRAVGALRASLGLANNAEDVRRAIEVISSFADEAWRHGSS